MNERVQKNLNGKSIKIIFFCNFLVYNKIYAAFFWHTWETFKLFDMTSSLNSSLKVPFSNAACLWIISKSTKPIAHKSTGSSQFSFANISKNVKEKNYDKIKILKKLLSPGAIYTTVPVMSPSPHGPDKPKSANFT